jgi:hypothetical protein
MLTHSPTLLYSVYVIVAHSATGCKGNSLESTLGSWRAKSARLSSIFQTCRSHYDAMAVSSQIETSVHIERHYAVTEIAEMWNLSSDKVRELFETEPGVLVLGDRTPRHKRRYVTLRIPHSVLERVHHRLSSKFGLR